MCFAHRIDHGENLCYISVLSAILRSNSGKENRAVATAGSGVQYPRGREVLAKARWGADRGKVVTGEKSHGFIMLFEPRTPITASLMDASRG